MASHSIEDYGDDDDDMLSIFRKQKPNIILPKPTLQNPEIMTKPTSIPTILPRMISLDRLPEEAPITKREPFMTPSIPISAMQGPYIDIRPDILEWPWMHPVSTMGFPRARYGFVEPWISENTGQVAEAIHNLGAELPVRAEPSLPPPGLYEERDMTQMQSAAIQPGRRKAELPE